MRRLLPRLPSRFWTSSLATPAALIPALVTLLALHASPIVAQETRTFQQGVGGYQDTLDLHLAIPQDFMWEGHKEAEFVTDPDNPIWEWDHQNTWGEGSTTWFSDASKYGWGDIIGPLQFRDIFGDQADQISPRCHDHLSNPSPVARQQGL
jgi:hypothetical protein